jgi:hypothetical protein
LTCVRERATQMLVRFDVDEVVGAIPLVNARFRVSKRSASFVEAGVCAERNVLSDFRVAGECGDDGTQGFHVEAGVAHRGALFAQLEPQDLADVSGGISGEEAERRATRGHSENVFDESDLEPVAVFLLGVPPPRCDPIFQGRRGEKDGLPDLGALEKCVEPQARGTSIAFPDTGIVRNLRGPQIDGPILECREGQERRPNRDEAGRRAFAVNQSRLRVDDGTREVGRDGPNLNRKVTCTPIMLCSFSLRPLKGREFYEIANLMGEGMKIDRILVMVLAAMVPTGAAWAHSGHGDPRWSGSLLHFLSEPEHAIPSVLVLAAIVVGTAFARRNTRLEEARVNRRNMRSKDRHRS